MNSPLTIGTTVAHYGTVEAVVWTAGERYYMLNSWRGVSLIPAYIIEDMVKATQPRDIGDGHS